MKTHEEWQEELKQKQGLRITLTAIIAIQRDTRAAATKAQMEKDGASVNEWQCDYSTLDPSPTLTPSPFPEKEVKG